MIVDYDGRILAQAESGPGERIVVGPVDIRALREERERRRGHHMLSHLRTELYGGYARSIYPRAAESNSIEANSRLIDAAKARVKSRN